MECGCRLVAPFFRRICTTSPTRTRMKGPGTVPPNVQNVYWTPSARVPFTSVVSSATMTRAFPARSTGGGTCGAEARIALTSGSAASPPFARAWLCQLTAPPARRPTTATVAISVSPRFSARPSSSVRPLRAGGGVSADRSATSPACDGSWSRGYDRRHRAGDIRQTGIEMADHAAEGGDESQSPREEKASGNADPGGLAYKNSAHQQRHAAHQGCIRECLEARARGPRGGGPRPAARARGISLAPDKERHDLEHHADDRERDPTAEDGDGVGERRAWPRELVSGETHAEHDGRRDERCTGERESEAPAEVWPLPVAHRAAQPSRVAQPG